MMKLEFDTNDYLNEIKNNNNDIVICPSFTSLSEASKLLENTSIELGAQNMHFEESGAFTGEISPILLKEIGCKYIILGHSDRRQIFKEDNELINKILLSACNRNEIKTKELEITR